MSEPTGGLEVRLTHRVHPGLSLDVAFRLGSECGILFGPSGAGKTTVLRLIAGLIRPEAGFVRLEDRVVVDTANRVREPLRHRQIGLIFQDDLLFPHLSVEQNVRFGLQGRPREEATARMAEVAALCGIESLLGGRPITLSGGERQRVGLARAIAPRPRLLLCDEPVSALDLDARHALIGRLKAIQKSESIPVLYVTHAIDEAIALGDRLFLLQDGRIVAEGSPLDVLAARGPDGSHRWTSLRNLFETTLEGDDPDGRSSVLRILDGPSLVVPRLDRPAGSRMTVGIRADDIVLSKGPIGAISARNLIAGRVDRVVPHGLEAEVLVRSGGVLWVVGVVAAAVEALGLIPGEEVRMIVKARSCQVLREEST